MVRMRVPEIRYEDAVAIRAANRGGNGIPLGGPGEFGGTRLGPQDGLDIDKPAGLGAVGVHEPDVAIGGNVADEARVRQFGARRVGKGTLVMEAEVLFGRPALAGNPPEPPSCDFGPLRYIADKTVREAVSRRA